MIMIIHISSIIFLVSILVVVLFQFALALGTPWGAYAMGGKFPGRFPRSMRFACLIQIAILILVASIVMSKSGVWLADRSSFADIGIWFVVAFSAVATLLNLITRSVWERRIWAPVSILMLVTSVIIAVFN
ncbi:hypothetical protein ACTHPF_13430 [Paenibacillus sp. SAF-054]